MNDALDLVCGNLQETPAPEEEEKVAEPVTAEKE